MFSFDPLKTTLILPNNKTNTAILSATTLRGKCTNTEFFAPRIFLYSEWMRIFTQCNYTTLQFFRFINIFMYESGHLQCHLRVHQVEKPIPIFFYVALQARCENFIPFFDALQSNPHQIFEASQILEFCL